MSVTRMADNTDNDTPCIALIYDSGFRIQNSGGVLLPKKCLRFTAVRPMRKKNLEVEVQQIMTRWSSSSRQPGAEINQWDKNQTWSSQWLKISLLQTEFGFRNRGYSCSWNPESSNSFFRGIRNTAWRVQNPIRDLNPNPGSPNE